jgi:hypothetical protein
LLGYVAVIWSGGLRGYSPSRTVAARDIAFLFPIIAAFLAYSQAAVQGRDDAAYGGCFLFVFGQLTQYRLFSDPEYGARGAARAKAREAKAQTVRLLNIETGYDDEKKTFMFGSPSAVPRKAVPVQPVDEYSIGDLLTSVNTYIPLAAFFLMGVAFRAFTKDDVLLWLQRHALLIGLATLLPFAVLVVAFSDEGKFLGQTTPWEGVKILFLVSFAGMLADTYRHLRLTRWGCLLLATCPVIVIAAMPVVPFFALSDFGQMLVSSAFT